MAVKKTCLAEEIHVVPACFIPTFFSLIYEAHVTWDQSSPVRLVDRKVYIAYIHWYVYTPSSRTMEMSPLGSYLLDGFVSSAYHKAANTMKGGRVDTNV